MSVDLREALEDLVSDGPPSGSSLEVGQRAWAAGRRRRRMREVRMVAAVLLIVVLGALTLPLVRQADPVEPTDDDGFVSVHGYPERIGHQVWVGDLPSAPGPLAMLIERVAHHATYDQPLGWDAVSESGQRWHLAELHSENDDWPALSPDGRYLAYLAGVHGPWEIRDLVTGHVIRFPTVGSALGRPTTRYQTEGQSPWYWSPDGKHVVITGFRRDHAGRGLVLGLDGAVTLLHDTGLPAGWLDDQTMVWLAPSRSGGGKRATVQVRFVDLRGTVERSVTLARHLPPLLDQWAGAVSADGRQIAVTSSGNFADQVARFSLQTGRQLGRVDLGEQLGSTCATAWAGSHPVLPVLDDDDVYPGIATPNGFRRLVAIEPRLGPECVVWAQDALDGTRHSMLFGLSMAGWTWWWREVAIGLILFISSVGFVSRWMAVRRHRMKAVVDRG
jgi:hypothetical protein